MDLKGFDDFIKKCERDSDKHLEGLQKKITAQILRDVKNNTPIKTGALKRSWRIKRKGPNETLIYNNRNYAIYVEYGHRIKKSSKDIRYDSKSRSFKAPMRVVPGRFMLKKALLRAKVNLKDEVKLMFGDLWR